MPPKMSKRARSGDSGHLGESSSATSAAVKAAATKGHQSPAAAVAAAAAAASATTTPKTTQSSAAATASPKKGATKVSSPPKKVAAAASARDTKAKAVAPAAASSPKKALRGAVDPDLPVTPEGVVYHLACRRQDLADKFILVGDPNRVAVVAERFDKGSLTFSGSHREINVMTGKYKGVPVTCLSTGMGTDNVEIVINEIHALKEYHVATQRWQTAAERKPGNVHLIRVGTCGCPQPDIGVGTLAISNHSIGMDNTCRYYEPPAVNQTASVKALAAAANKTPLGKVGVYATRAHPDVVAALIKSADAFNKAQKKGKGASPATPYVVGTTASGSGFYGCQGRAVGQFRGHLTVPNLVDDLGGIQFPVDGGKTTERVVNIEMENSALCYLSNVLGYKAGTVCAIVARRAGEMREFATPEVAKAALANAITIALDALVNL